MNSFSLLFKEKSPKISASLFISIQNVENTEFIVQKIDNRKKVQQPK